jgi:hypothetical protein
VNERIRYTAGLARNLTVVGGLGLDVSDWVNV